MLGHRAVTTTIRYLGLKEENLKRAAEVLATKYAAPTQIGTSQLQSVPESVPTILKNARTTITDRVEKSITLAG
jgi:hypothetical protein